MAMLSDLAVAACEEQRRIDAERERQRNAVQREQQQWFMAHALYQMTGGTLDLHSMVAELVPEGQAVGDLLVRVVSDGDYSLQAKIDCPACHGSHWQTFSDLPRLGELLSDPAGYCFFA